MRSPRKCCWKKKTSAGKKGYNTEMISIRNLKFGEKKSKTTKVKKKLFPYTFKYIISKTTDLPETFRLNLLLCLTH